MTIWERGCRRKRKAVYLSTFSCIFFPTIWTDILMFSFWTRPCKWCSHLWWIIKRKWLGQKLGCKRSELGHSPAGCRHVSKCPFWHQNSILKHLQWCPISFRVKAKILTMALSQWLLPLPISLASFPTTHLPSQLPSAILFAFSHPRAFAHAITLPRMLPPHPDIWSSHFLKSSCISSNVTVPEKPCLTISYKCTILHWHFLPPGLSYMYLFLYLNAWSPPLKCKHHEGREFVWLFFTAMYSN